jgi:hypothetical protein
MKSGTIASGKLTFSRIAAIMAGRRRTGLTAMIRNSTCHARHSPAKP